MEEIYSFLNQYSFFQERENYKIEKIQNYNRKSKFRVIYKEEAYLVLVEEQRIQKYLSRLNVLNEDYKKQIEFRYLSKDKKVLVFNYYGSLNGKDLSYYARNNIELSNESLANQLHFLMEDMHSKKEQYIDFDSRGANWYEFVFNILSKTTSIAMEHKGITLEEQNLILNAVKNNKNYFDRVETCYIHADLTIVNVCYDLEKDLVYLIDFDDLMIGDPFFDYCRIMNFANESDVLKKFKELFCNDIFSNIIFIIYTLRTILNWYNYILEQKLDYSLPIEEIKMLISDLKKLSSN